MRQIFLAVVLVVFGAAAGVGVTAMIAKSKVDEKNTALENSQQEITGLKEMLEKAGAKNRSLDSNISRQDIELAQVKKELRQANLDLKLAKEELEKTKEPVVVRELAEFQNIPKQPAAINEPVSNIATVEYVVDDGDNFWKIAEKQLGKGSRSSEIMNLNPEAAELPFLKKGMKLRLPAK